MIHAYPEDFAIFVADRLSNAQAAPDELWRTEVLVDLFSAAYQASLLREEERALTFRVVLAPPEVFEARPSVLVGYAPYVPAYGPHVVRFDSKRTLHEGELRRLAPAAKFHRSLIGVCLDENGQLKIWGIIHTGPGWMKAIQGGRGAPPYFPGVLVLSVSGPGRLVVAREGRTVAKLSGGQITCDTPDIFASRWLPDAFSSVRQELWELHLARRQAEGFSGSGVDLDVVRMLGQQFLRRTIATIRMAHHGGALVIAPPVRAASPAFWRRLRVKYPLADDEPRRRFRSLILSVMDELARREHARPGEKVGWREYNEAPSPGIAALEEGFAEFSSFVSGLAEVDGAVVMTQRYEVLGFGAEIAGDLPEVPQVARALDLEGYDRALESTDGVGTRHRSMYRLCDAFRDVLGVVISQDGGVRFVRWARDVVTYWDQVTIGALDV